MPYLAILRFLNDPPYLLSLIAVIEFLPIAIIIFCDTKCIGTLVIKYQMTTCNVTQGYPFAIGGKSSLCVHSSCIAHTYHGDPRDLRLSLSSA